MTSQSHSLNHSVVDNCERKIHFISLIVDVRRLQWSAIELGDDSKWLEAQVPGGHGPRFG